ncbi:PREDICTED: protocadherin Fat 4-like [Branchiostoma belcheri]|uniref:Protocadherin Fat 4-like n=1 Tax=Branchiostoma belcheri TaxID=7741 RepID=A0A6P4YS04_BRABE|nr:PREDICTED: protocadherin Fat 4-like [Branchiostoma belcheri]
MAVVRESGVYSWVFVVTTAVLLGRYEVTAQAAELCWANSTSGRLIFEVEENVFTTGEAVTNLKFFGTYGVDISNITITSQTPGGYFRLDLQNNTDFVPLVLVQDIDRDGPPILTKIELTVSCSPSLPGSSRETALIVNILDANDNDPEFQDAPYNTAVSEYEQVGTTVFTLSATDIDSGANSQRVFYLLRTTPQPYFAVGTGGAVTLSSSLNYDTGPRHFELLVQVQDLGTPPRSSNTTLTIDVDDEDDLDPVFQHDIYEASVMENATSTLTTSPAAILAYDQDFGINQTLVYSIQKASSTPTDLADLIDYFSIDGSTGELSVVRGLDRESVHDVTLTIKAVQSDNNVRSAEARVYVVVQDANDNQPQMSADLYQATVVENAPRGTPVLTVTASDKDEGENAEFVYVLKPSDVFTIDGSTGYITVSNSSILDRETNNNFTLEVYAVETNTSEKYPSPKSTVTITLLDENDNSPTFTADTYEAAVPENAAPGVFVTQVTATDRDSGTNGEIIYSIVFASSDGKDKFSISPSDGNITVSGRLDADTVESYVVVVMAADQGTASRVSTAIVNINVTNVNDNTPQFSQQRYTAQVSEAAATGTVVATLKATDGDKDAQLTFQIEDGSFGQFNLSTASNGDVQVVTSAELDREIIDSYIITVEVSDGQWTNSTQLRVNVQDVNDNFPVFNQRDYAFDIPEEEAASYAVGSIFASDNDTGINADILYSIQPSSPDFSVDQSTGQITTLWPLDRETASQVLFVAVASDQGRPSLSSTATVTVVLLDINDNLPTFTQQSYMVTVNENVTESDLITLQATDLDSDPNNITNYVITEGDTNVFNIDPTTGRLSLVTPLDRDGGPATYNLTVMAYNTELYNGTGENNTATVVVSVQDINDNPPVFTPDQYLSTIFENITIGTTVLTVNATDDDTDPANSEIHFSIVSGNDDSVFSINPVSGAITVLKEIDYDPPSNNTGFELQVLATDGMYNTTAMVNIMVTDVNDNAPEFTQDVYEVGVNETAADGVQVVMVTATDNDSGDNGNITYTIISGNQNMTFAIDEVSGEITLQKSLDYDQGKKSYQLVVEAKDAGTPVRSSIAIVDILVVNENDNSPVFQDPTYIFDVYENERKSSFVGTVHASDLDGDNLNYTIVDSVMGYFSIDSATGEIITSSQLDRETNSSFTFNVIVRDPVGQEDTAVVTVEVLDENDNSPVFDREIYAANVPENTTGGSLILQVTASDEDEGSNSNITYSIRSGNTEDIFFINNKSGTIFLQTNKTLDYETTQEYRLSIKAQDGGDSPRSDVADVTISVIGVNEFPPQCKETPFQVSLMENLPSPAQLLQVEVTHEDAAEILEYKLVQGQNSTSPFSIDPKTGLLNTTQALDREETPQYSLNVSVSDGENVEYCQVQVTILDQNDNTPQFFPSNSSHFNVLESVAVGTVVGQVSANDKDAGANGRVTFYLSSGADGRFAVDRESGNITVVASLDHESLPDPNIMLTVVAADGGEEPKYAVSTVTISVMDINDNAPEFDSSHYNFQVSENMNASSLVGTVFAEDTDEGMNGEVKYYLDPSGQEVPFNISEETGNITTTEVLDREGGVASYTFTVIAQDNGTPTSLNSNATVTVSITDENDNAPKFNPAQYHVSILEQSPIGMVVAETFATDADVGTNAELSYSLRGNGTKYFSVLNGLVRIEEILTVEKLTEEGLISGLANETNSTTIRFKVIATDDGNPRLSGEAEVFITVGDVKDATPVFGNSTYNVRVAEDRATGTPLDFNISASSEDPDTVISFELLNWLDTFELQQGDNMATVQIKSSLDRETRDSYELLVRATDDKIPQHTAYTTVEVTVTDINDQDPTFQSLSYHFTVSEDATHGSVVGTVTATDMDQGKNGEVMYRITGDNGNVFSIDNTTGQITTTGQLDREQMAGYNITVMATDMGSPARNTTALVTVSVEDINDSPPVFSNSSFEVYIGETVRIGSQVFLLSATDPDSGPLNNLVYYSITGGNDDDTFFVETQLGTVKTAARLGSVDTYTLSVQAYNPPAFVPDGVLLDSNANLTVHVNRAPRYSRQPYLKVLRENATVGTEVAQILTSDPDGDNITLNITAGNEQGVFTIDQMGVVSVSAPLSANTFQHILTVAATDDGNPPMTRSTTVTVYVLPANVSLPLFSKDLYDVTIPENLPPQSFVVMATAVYVTEESVNYPLRYSILNGNTGGYFRIDETTGSITTNRSLGDIPQSSAVLSIMVAVNGTRALTAMATVNITVVDQNDNAPVFDPTNIEAAVPEDAVLGAEVVVLTATDADKGLNAELQYFIHSGGDGKFALDNSTGSLTVAGDLIDLGSVQYEIVVYAEDMGLPIDGLSPLRGYATVVVTVEDINNHAPQFVQPAGPFSVMENTGPVELGVIKVTDLDTAEVNTDVSYEITGGNDYTSFSINASSGLLMSTMELDRENTSSYSLVITATNYRADPQLNSSTVVEVIVQDQNDNSPTFNSSDYAVQIDLTTSVGSEVIQVFAEDHDEGANGDIWYFLKTDDSYSTYFTLDDPNQGIITTRQEFNFNDSVKVFELQVTAYDGGEPRESASTTVTVTVVNTAFNQPIFTEQQIVVSPLENQPAGTTVVTLSATHYTDPSGDITYYCIRSGNELGNFALNNKTGELYTTRELDREDTAVYTLTVEAILVNGTGGCDSRRRKRAIPANQIVITVEVGDQNDNPPVFSQSSYVKGIPDDAPIGYTVMQLQASDADTGSNAELTYGFVGTKPDQFELESSTGTLLTAISFAGSSGDKFKFGVQVEDNDGNSNSTEVTVFVLTFTQHVILEAGLSPSVAVENQEEIAEFLQNITGYDINVHKIVPLEEDSGKTNFSASEIWFYAVDPQTNEIVETSDVENVIAANREQWEEFLDRFSGNRISQPVPQLYTDTTIGVLEGSLIAVAGVILIGGLIAVYAVHASWKKRVMENVNEVSMFEKYSVSEENNLVLTNPTYVDTTMEGPTIQVIQNDDVQETWVAPMNDLQQKDASHGQGNGDTQHLIQQDQQGYGPAGGQRLSDSDIHDPSSAQVDDLVLATVLAAEGRKPSTEKPKAKGVTWAADVKTDSTDQDKTAVDIPDDADAKSDFASEPVHLSPVMGPSPTAAALMVTSQPDIPPFPNPPPQLQDDNPPEDYPPEDYPPPPPLPFSDPPDLLPSVRPTDHNSNVPKDNPFTRETFDSAITDTSTPKKKPSDVPGILAPVPTPFTQVLSLSKQRRSEPLETILMSSPASQVHGEPVPVTDIDALIWDDEEDEVQHIAVSVV